VELQNTILARNSVGAFERGPDCYGSVVSLGHNLIGDPTDCTITLQPTDLTGDPGLGEFTDNGTPGHGHSPLLPTSPVIGMGDDSACPETDQLGNPRFSPCDIGAIEFQHSPSIALRLNQTAFRPGETLIAGLQAQNLGSATAFDVYFAAILPDGESLLFITSLDPLDGIVTTLSAPQTFQPLARAHRPATTEVTLPNFFRYTFHGLETPGTYHLIVALTPVGAFDDGSIDEGDILALDWEAFHFSSGASQALYATMQAIRTRHMTQASSSLGPAD
jgi:hypothetical protein